MWQNESKMIFEKMIYYQHWNICVALKSFNFSYNIFSNVKIFQNASSQIQSQAEVNIEFFY